MFFVRPAVLDVRPSLAQLHRPPLLTSWPRPLTFSSTFLNPCVRAYLYIGLFLLSRLPFLFSHRPYSSSEILLLIPLCRFWPGHDYCSQSINGAKFLKFGSKPQKWDHRIRGFLRGNLESDYSSRCTFLKFYV